MTRLLAALLLVAAVVVPAPPPATAAPTGAGREFHIQAPRDYTNPALAVAGTRCFRQGSIGFNLYTFGTLAKSVRFGVEWCERNGKVIQGTKWWCDAPFGSLLFEYDPCSAKWGPYNVSSRYFEGDWDLAWVYPPHTRYDVNIKGHVRADGLVIGYYESDW